MLASYIRRASPVLRYGRPPGQQEAFTRWMRTLLRARHLPNAVNVTARQVGFPQPELLREMGRDAVQGIDESPLAAIHDLLEDLGYVEQPDHPTGHMDTLHYLVRHLLGEVSRTEAEDPAFTLRGLDSGLVPWSALMVQDMGGGNVRNMTRQLIGSADQVWRHPSTEPQHRQFYGGLLDRMSGMPDRLDDGNLEDYLSTYDEAESAYEHVMGSPKRDNILTFNAQVASRLRSLLGHGLGRVLGE